MFIKKLEWNYNIVFFFINIYIAQKTSVIWFASNENLCCYKCSFLILSVPIWHSFCIFVVPACFLFLFSFSTFQGLWRKRENISLLHGEIDLSTSEWSFLLPWGYLSQAHPPCLMLKFSAHLKCTVTIVWFLNTAVFFKGPALHYYYYHYYYLHVYHFGNHSEYHNILCH